MFTVRIDRPGGQAREVLAVTRYSVSRDAQQALVLTVTEEGGVPRPIALDAGTRVFVMNASGATVDSLSVPRTAEMRSGAGA